MLHDATMLEGRDPLSYADIVTRGNNVPKEIDMLKLSDVPPFVLDDYRDAARLDTTSTTGAKASAGRLLQAIVTVPGSAGSLVLNDAAAPEDATPENEIVRVAVADLSVGQALTPNWPCLSGITISELPTDGAVVLTFQ